MLRVTSLSLFFILFLNGCGIGLCVDDGICSSETAISPPPRLAFTGNSHPDTPMMDRFFDEVDDQWLLTGECDVDKGAVTLSGTGLFTSVQTPCDETDGGTFQVAIQYASGSPLFDYVRHVFGRKEVTIAQTGVDAIKTYVFMSKSTHTVSTISTPTQFQAIASGNPNAYYVLTADLDFSTVSPTNNLTTIADFHGILEGNGHTVSNIHRQPAAGVPATIFGDLCSTCSFVGDEYTSIQNLTLSNLTMIASGAANAAGLAAQAAPGNMGAQIYNVHISGTVQSAATQTGGIFGIQQEVDMTDCSFTGTVTGTSQCGGLVGFIGTGFTPINGNRFSGTVSGTTQVGGIVGRANGVFRRNSTSGTVIGTSTRVGGIVGDDGAGTWQTNRSDANVTGTQRVGGIVGQSDSYHEDSYFTGTVTGTSNIGGIVGMNSGEGARRGYSTGAVIGTGANVGPLSGDNGYFAFTNMYYLSTATCSGCNNTYGTAALTAAQMKLEASFSGFDFTTLWRIAEGVAPPHLYWEDE